MTLYTVKELRAFSNAAFAASGLSPEHAATVTEVLIHADLRGHPSHGLTRIPIYVDRIRRGAVKAVPQISFERTAPSFLYVDGDNGPGPVVTAAALEAGLEFARETGVCAITIAHSNHNGSGSFYAERAVAQGCIAIATTNAPPSMAVFGGRAPALGTNPITFGTPVAGDMPLLLDMATSLVARGKIVEAAKRGEAIPEGWALDAQGRPTISAIEAERGVVLPMAGSKGSGLAIMVEVLAGVLSGGRFAGKLGNLYSDFETPQDVGHFLLLINLGSTHLGSVYPGRVRDLTDELRRSARAEGFERIFMPGEIEHCRAQASLARGIELPANVRGDLANTARELGIAELDEEGSK